MLIEQLISNASTHERSRRKDGRGNGSWIGNWACISGTLCRGGANVVVADIVAETGRETVDLIEDAGGDATFVEVDVCDFESVENMVDVAVDTYGSLDFAHNNAGILTGFAGVTDIEDAQWDKLMDINLKGIWACLKAELPVMEAQGSGAIVNTASESGLVGMGDSPAIRPVNTASSASRRRSLSNTRLGVFE